MPERQSHENHGPIPDLFERVGYTGALLRTGKYKEATLPAENLAVASLLIAALLRYVLYGECVEHLAQTVVGGIR
jgi:hypothetical protein